MIAALTDLSTGVQVEGVNYFADTLLFGGAILSLAWATHDLTRDRTDRCGQKNGSY
jgi:hypothetical protein